MHISGDSCNNFTGSLKVNENCKEDRVRENYAIACRVELFVKQTKMFCGDIKPVNVVLNIDLKSSNVANESELLLLSYGGEVIEVDINK